MAPPDQSSRTILSRRKVLAGGLGLVAVGGGALVVRNQIRHPHRDKKTRPDGRFRRLAIACPHPGHDPVLALAQRQGIFARYNLEVTLLDGLTSARDALDQIANNKAAAAVAPVLSWLPRMMSPYAGQPVTPLPARLVFGLQSNSSRLLVPRGAPIRRIEDLNRKAIGIADPDGPDRMFFSIMMRRKGMDPNRDVRWVGMQPDAFDAALAAKEIQAVAGHDPVIWQVRERLHLSELASSMTGSYGIRVGRALGVQQALLRDDPPAVTALALALGEAAATVAHNVDEAASVVADDLEDMDEDSVRRMMRSEGHSLQLTGKPLREQVAQYVDELKLLGLVADEVDSGAVARQCCAAAVHG
jgi:NitT/TauT family transport system substrate-binding protein